MSKKSVVVSGGGLFLGMLTNADQIRRELGITDEEFHVLATEAGNEHWRRLFEGMQQKKEKATSNSSYETCRVTVGIHKSLEEAIEAGDYDNVDHNITSEHFSLGNNELKCVEITLVHRNKIEQTDQLLEEFVESGKYRNAVTEEILALGAQNPKLQQQFPIVTLWWDNLFDSYWKSLSLFTWNGERRLGLEKVFNKGWESNTRFAFVRKNRDE